MFVEKIKFFKNKTCPFEIIIEPNNPIYRVKEKK
jgi:hypothetical protein